MYILGALHSLPSSSGSYLLSCNRYFAFFLPLCSRGSTFNCVNKNLDSSNIFLASSFGDLYRIWPNTASAHKNVSASLLYLWQQIHKMLDPSPAFRAALWNWLTSSSWWKHFLTIVIIVILILLFGPCIIGCILTSLHPD